MNITTTSFLQVAKGSHPRDKMVNNLYDMYTGTELKKMKMTFYFWDSELVDAL